MTIPAYRPMLATPWPEAFSDDEWAFDVKWDGIRVIVAWDGEHALLRSRNGRDITSVYPELAGFRTERPRVIDGEIVAFDEEGRPSFAHLQKRMNVVAPRPDLLAEVPVSCVVFDLLYDGRPVISEPQAARWELLSHVELPPPYTTADPVPGDGEALFAAVQDQGLEGMVGKRLTAPYRPGVRSPDWRKVANVLRMRAIIGGFTPGTGGRSPWFGALVLGLWEGDSLRYVGSVGTGFDDAMLRRMRAALELITQSDSPFLPDAALPRAVTWVAPRLVAEIDFKSWTLQDRLRAPSFKGLSDVAVESVTWAAEHPNG